MSQNNNTIHQILFRPHSAIADSSGTNTGGGHFRFDSTELRFDSTEKTVDCS